MNLVIGGGHDELSESCTGEIFTIEFSAAVAIEISHCSIGHQDENRKQIESAE